MLREEKALPCCGPQKPHYKGLRAKGEVMSMLAERLEGKKGDGSAWVAFKAATVGLKPNRRGAQAVTSYVAFADYNFVTCLVTN